MSASNHSESNGNILSSLRDIGVEAIDSYEEQSVKAIDQAEETAQRFPGAQTFAGAQAELARTVVKTQAWGARQLIGA
jgi:hypothetical protein